MSAFPRGSGAGASSASTAQKRTLSEESLFGSKRAKRIEIVPSKKKGSGKIETSKTTTLLGGIGLGMTKTVGNKSQVKIDSVSIQRLNTGCCVLGYVLQISDKNVVVSLPGGFTGSVAPHEISDVVYKMALEEQEQQQRGRKPEKSVVPEPSSLLKVHQMVRCIVLEQTQKSGNSKRVIVRLSLRSSLINKGLALKHLSEGSAVNGCVVSREDGGYVVDAGVRGVNFFLPEKAVPGNFGTLSTGQPVECVVAKLNEGARAATLRAHPKAVYEALTFSSSLTFSALSPGMRVNVVVDKVVENGLLVSFMSMFHGVIDTASLSRPYVGNSWNETVSAGDVLQARIVLVDHGNKSVRLSMRPHVMEMRCIKNLPSLGSVVEGMNVAAVHKKVGIVLISVPTSTVEAEAAETATEETVGSKGSKGARKEAAEAAKRKVERDESILGCFISRHALSATLKDSAEPDSSSDESSDEQEKVPKKKMKSTQKSTVASLNEPINVDDISKRYKVGVGVSAVKVLGYNLVEGWFIGSNLLDDLSSNQMTHSSEIHVGQTVNVEITAIRDFGLVVRIGRKISAVCPLFHSADIVGASKLHKKFKVGQKLTMRVWEVDGSSIIVTNKKTIVELPSTKIIQSYNDATVGGVATGVIGKISEDGLQVRFFNKVKGLVPSSVLAKQGVLNPSEEYREGQTLSVVFIRKAFPRASSKKSNKASSNGNSPTLFLGLDMSKDTTSIVQLMSDKDVLLREMIAEGSFDSGDADTLAVKSSKDSKAFEIVSGSVFKIDDDSIVHIRLDDGRLAKAHVHQLYDFAATADSVFSRKSSSTSWAPFAEGTRIERALVLSETRNVVNVTMKPLLLAVAEAAANRSSTGSTASTSSAHLSATVDDISIPSALGDLIPGQTVAGYVSKVESFGVFIAFQKNLSALAPRPNIADRFIASPVDLYRAGDSVRCVVQRVDLSKERVIVTLKPSMVTPSSGEFTFLRSWLREQYEVAQSMLIDSKKSMPSWQTFAIGSVVEATVSAIEGYGTVFLAGDDTTVLLDKSICKPKSKKSAAAETEGRLVVGDKVKVFILDINFEDCVLEVSAELAKKSVSKDKSKKSNKSVSSAPRIGSQLSGTVVKVGSHYIVASINTGAAAAVAYASRFDFHCPRADADASYQLGSMVELEVLDVPHSASAALVTFPHATQMFCKIAENGSGTSGRNSVARTQLEAEQSDAALRQRIGGAGDASVDSPSALVLKQKFLDSMRVGYMTKWLITEISAHEVLVQPEFNSLLGLNIKAIVHITGAINATDSHDNLVSALKTVGTSSGKLTPGHPFFGLQVGQKLWCYVLQVRRESKDGKDSFVVYLSMTSTSNGVPADSMEPTSSSRRERSDSSVSETADPPQHKEPFKPMLQAHGKNELKSNWICPVVVTKIDGVNFYVAITPYLSGVLNIMDVSTDKKTLKAFMKHCFVGLRLIVAVTDISKEDNRIRNIRVSRAAIEELISPDAPHFDLSRCAEQRAQIAPQPTYKAGDVVTAVVNLHHRRVARPPAIALSVRGNPSARVCITELCEPADWKDLSSFFMRGDDDDGNDTENRDCLSDLFSHGELVKARVLSVDARGMLELSLRPSRVGSKNISTALKEDVIPPEGSVVQAFVANASSKGCFLRLSSTVTGQVLMKDISDVHISDPAGEFPMGKLVTARLLTVNHADSHAKLSLKTSAIVGNAKAQEEIALINVGDTVSGVVHQVNAMGVFVALDNTSLVGLSRRATAVSNEQKLPSEEFSVGDIVRAKVLSVSRASLKVGLGLKESYFRKDGIQDSDSDSDDNSISDSAVPDDSGGFESSEDDGENESCGDEEDDLGSEEEEEDTEEDSDENDLVYANMVNGSDVDSDDEVEAMIKAASLPYSEESDGSEDDESAVGKPKSSKSKRKIDQISSSDGSGSDSEDISPPKGSKHSANRETVANPADSDSDSDSEPSKNIFGSAHPNGKGKPARPGAGGTSVMWDDFDPSTGGGGSGAIEESESDEDSDAESEYGGASSGKLRARQKESLKRKAEADIRLQEERLLDDSAAPQNKQDFERLLIAQPNSSYLWIQFMAFFLQSADIENARAVAARALRTIGFREEEEKFNVWMALLNMEHKYGDTQTLESNFVKAVQESKGKLIFMGLADIYSAAGDPAGAEAVYAKALKRPQYKKSKKVWAAYLLHKLKCGDTKGAKEQLTRALQCLSRHKHVELISKHALSEFDVGSEDRGRVLFEELLNSYPKRTDLWHLYIDKETKHQNVDQVRQLFNRLVCAKISSRNVKTAFKKWLSFELKWGDEDSQESVKAKAREYVSSITA